MFSLFIPYACTYEFVRTNTDIHIIRVEVINVLYKTNN